MPITRTQEKLDGNPSTHFAAVVEVGPDDEDVALGLGGILVGRDVNKWLIGHALDLILVDAVGWTHG